MSAQGKTLHTQAQQFVLNLLQYFEREKENGGPLISVSAVQERVANALGISEKTVRNIKSRAAANPVLTSPGKKRPRKKLKSHDLPETSKMGIRNTLYNMYAQKKHVTVASLNTEIRNSHILVSDRSLHRAIQSLGFKFKKDSNRRALLEKSYIAEMRIKFLKQYIKEINSPNRRQVVFMDETWIYSKGNPGKSWQNEDIRSVRKPEGYDGKRFIVVHAGSARGFVQGAALLFASRSLKEDYHGEMNGDMFKKWLIEHLLNNLEEPSLIIIDNAPYHSMLVEKLPTSSWTKSNMVSWLTQKNVSHDPTLFKTELYGLIKSLQIQKRYEVDEIIRSYGHEVLRLPPYHCEFNAIELVWAHAKGYYDRHIGRDGYKDENVIAMWNEALQQCDETVWANCVRHTEETIKEWYKREEMLDITVDELVINVGNCSESSDVESDSD